VKTRFKTRGKIGLALLALLVFAGSIAFINRDAILMRMFTRAVDKAMTRSVMASLDPKALHVGFCGTGSPLPSRERAGACTVVIAGGTLFVFDTGDGAGEVLSLMGLPLGKIEGVWLTHLHSDHFEGLGPLALQRWVGTSASTPLAVAGPPGTEKVAQGLTLAYQTDSGFRIAHHGTGVVPPSGVGITGSVIAPGIVYDKGGVRITAFAVNHAPVAPAYGYRVDWGGRSVTISGDTAASPALIAAAKGTDVLVHEVLAPGLVRVMENAARASGQTNRAKIFSDITGYHSSPAVAGEAATASGAKVLAFTHIVPSVPAAMMRLVIKGADKAYNGPIWAMQDGDVISIPEQGAATKRNLLD
jgi:ribonuclease Z